MEMVENVPSDCVFRGVEVTSICFEGIEVARFKGPLRVVRDDTYLRIKFLESGGTASIANAAVLDLVVTP